MHNTLVLNLPISIKRHLVLRWRFSLRNLRILGFALVAFLLIFYIFQVNEITKAGFFISNYEKKIADIFQENKNLEINFSQANSLASLEILLKNLNYEEVGRIHYIQVLGSTVVAK